MLRPSRRQSVELKLRLRYTIGIAQGRRANWGASALNWSPEYGIGSCAIPPPIEEEIRATLRNAGKTPQIDFVPQKEEKIYHRFR
jgi:hypothetical protein